MAEMGWQHTRPATPSSLHQYERNFNEETSWTSNIPTAARNCRASLLAFMDEHIYPNEKAFKAEIDRNGVEKGNRWLPTKIIEDLKPLAREQGLWNLFLPKSPRAPEGLSNLDYAPLCEIMGRVGWAPEVFNCAAPDTGNMETIERYGTEEHKQQWLEPLLRGEIRSAFAMTEPARGLVGRDQHRDPHRARRRRLRDQRPQVVDLRRRRPALQDLHRDGQDRPGRGAPRAAVDDPGAGRYAGHDHRASAAGVRLRRRAARPLRDPVRERARAGVQHAAGRRPRLRDRPGPPRTGPHPPLHARHRRGRARAGTACAGA